MIEFLKVAKNKTLLSELTYYALNIGLAVALLVLAITIQSIWPALVLVLLSKWRVFAVRPRFWWANLQANMVDIIVGFGTVMLMYQPKTTLAVQIFLAVAYAVWLAVIKPLSKPAHMLAQSAIALTIGTTALLTMSSEWPQIIVVIGMFVIGYSVARHFLFSYDESQIVLLSLIWGLLFAEVGWLAYQWTFSYPLPLVSPLRLPQATIILLLLSFVAERAYRSWKEHEQVMKSDVLAPATLASALIAVILIFFNSVTI
ncbi:hypothetical protein EOM60_01735 [Candidatus Saccharibacteria bacterium]|nr:hypothetical protein [Candidatus Saccharibacteria bacterium]